MNNFRFFYKSYKTPLADNLFYASSSNMNRSLPIPLVLLDNNILPLLDNDGHPLLDNG